MGEPLSTALGTNAKPRPAASSSKKSKPRGDWVTFSSKISAVPPVEAPAGFGDSGFAPLDTVPSAFTEPAPHSLAASARPEPQHGWAFEADGRDDWSMEHGSNFGSAVNDGRLEVAPSSFQQPATV